MVRNLQLLGSALVLLVLLAACGEEDEPGGGTDTGTPTQTEAVATPDASPTAAATVTIEPTNTPWTEPQAPPPPSQPEVSEYSLLSEWDADWDRLGAMMLAPDGRLYIDDYVREQLLIVSTDGSEQPPLVYESPRPEFDELRNDFAVGQDGRIYLLEQSGTARVIVLETGGTVVGEWGGTVGFEQASLFDARTIAVAPDGHVFTTKPGILQMFSNDGTFVTAWDRVGESLFPAETYDMEIAGDTFFLAATGYRDDQNVILMLDLDGNLVSEPLVVGDPDDEGRIFPASLAIGPDGNLFIADPFSREIIVLSPRGDELTRWSLGPTEQRFPVIEIAVDDAGRVYVADDGQKAVLVYGQEQANDSSPTDTATLQASEAYLPCGAAFTILGHGFEPNTVVTLVETFDDGRVTELAEGRTDDEGFYPAQIAPRAGEFCRNPSLGLEGLEITIEAVVADVTQASVMVTIYPLHSLPALELSAFEAGCGEVVRLHGANFEPGSGVTVWVNPSQDREPAIVVEGVQVTGDGGFEFELDTRAFSVCKLATIDSPQEYVIQVGTERAGQEAFPSSYPAQRVMFTLLPSGA